MLQKKDFQSLKSLRAQSNAQTRITTAWHFHQSNKSVQRMKRTTDIYGNKKSSGRHTVSVWPHPDTGVDYALLFEAAQVNGR